MVVMGEKSLPTPAPAPVAAAAAPVAEMIAEEKGLLQNFLDALALEAEHGGDSYFDSTADSAAEQIRSDMELAKRLQQEEVERENRLKRQESDDRRFCAELARMEAESAAKKRKVEEEDERIAKAFAIEAAAPAPGPPPPRVEGSEEELEKRRKIDEQQRRDEEIACIFAGMAPAAARKTDEEIAREFAEREAKERKAQLDEQQRKDEELARKLDQEFQAELAPAPPPPIVPVVPAVPPALAAVPFPMPFFGGVGAGPRKLQLMDSRPLSGMTFVVFGCGSDRTARGAFMRIMTAISGNGGLCWMSSLVIPKPAPAAAAAGGRRRKSFIPRAVSVPKGAIAVIPDKSAGLSDEEAGFIAEHDKMDVLSEADLAELIKKHTDPASAKPPAVDHGSLAKALEGTPIPLEMVLAGLKLLPGDRRLRMVLRPGSEITARFCAKYWELREKHGEGKEGLVIAFHGTKKQAEKSIEEKGLLVPGTSGVRVAHGSALGVGIYTAADPNVTLSYAMMGVIFMVAVLRGKATDRRVPVHGHGRRGLASLQEEIGEFDSVGKKKGGVYVLPSEDQVLPLFVIDVGMKKV